MSERIQAPTKPPPLPRKSTSRLPWILGTVALLLVLLPPTAVLIGYNRVRASYTSAIRKLENEARQRGEPLTLAELQTIYPPIPDEENVAVALMAIWEKEDPAFWQPFLKGEQHLPSRKQEEYDPALPYLGSNAKRIPRIGSLDSNSLAAAELFLSRKESHLEQLRTALRRPGCRFPVKIEEGPIVLLPHLGLMKQEATYLQIDALVASEHGAKDTAIADLRDTGRMGQILADEPIILSQLVRVASLTIALEEMERLLTRQALTTDELERLSQFLESLNLHGVARFCLINDRPFSLSYFNPDVMARATTSDQAEENSDSPEETARKVRTGYRALQSVGFWDADRRLMLETYRDAIDLAGQETPESLKQIDDLFEITSRKARKFPPKFFSAMILPSLQNVPLRFATFEAHRRAALIAIAIQRYRLDNEGQIPKTLEPLVPAYLPAILSDPLDGQPMRFHKLEHGFVVYSVGRDREDNDGKERVRGSIEHTDITFTVER